MTLKTATETIPFTVDSDGIARISKTRITLDTVIIAFLEGATAEEIVQQYPTLNLADVYSVIGYYLRRRTEVENYFRQGEQQAKKVRKMNESRFDPYGIRDRLLARQAERAK